MGKKSDKDSGGKRLKKSERRRRILLELKLRPHVRISDLAARFGVSTETVRRDFDALADDGLVSRAHGGASSTAHGTYPALDERAGEGAAEREAIGQAAARLVSEGETLMIDGGSTTIELARALAWQGTRCRVITNSFPVAATLGQGAADVLICPGDYDPAEAAVSGTETTEFLARFRADRAFIGAAGLSDEGPSESVPGFAAVKRAMIARSGETHLLIGSRKFGRVGTANVSRLDRLASVIVDEGPESDLSAALMAARVGIIIAGGETPVQ